MNRQDAKSAKNGKKKITYFFKYFHLKHYSYLADLASWRFIALLFWLGPSLALAQQEQWVFLPVTPLFQPLIGDPREPQTSVLAFTNQTRFEGSIGTAFDLLRYDAADNSHWGWGVFGSGFILLDQEGAAFPMRGNDWYAGMSFSEVSGPFSQRLEFVHQSSHLGDSLEGILEPIIYNGENFNYTASFRPIEELRFYAGFGFWENFFPYDNASFASCGTEIYSSSTNFIGTLLRGYGTLHLKWKAQGGGVFNKTAQLGIQLKFSPEESRAVRLALVFYDGNTEYGQFNQSHDNHWAIGVYFDP